MKSCTTYKINLIINYRRRMIWCTPYLINRIKSWILFCANYHSILILMKDKYDLPIFLNKIAWTIWLAIQIVSCISINTIFMYDISSKWFYVRPISLTSNVNNKIMTYLHNKSNDIINDLSSFNKYYIRLIRQIKHHVQLT